MDQGDDGRPLRLGSVVGKSRWLSGYLRCSYDQNHNILCFSCPASHVHRECNAGSQRAVAIFPDDRPAPELDCEVMQVRLRELSLHRPRQWGACWLALELWDQLDLDGFWSLRLPPSRQGTRWLNVLKTLVTYRLIEPSSSISAASLIASQARSAARARGAISASSTEHSHTLRSS
jgi:hypothetical protein